MSAPPKEPVSSDNEGQERPVRERLRNTSIAGTINKGAVPEPAESDGDTKTVDPAQATTWENGTTSAESATDRGRAQRKRSHDDLEGSDAEEEPARKGRHGRKRSRDSAAEEEDEHFGKRKVSGESTRDAAEGHGTAEPPSVNGTKEAPPSTADASSAVLADDGQTQSMETGPSLDVKSNGEGGSRDETETQTTSIPPASGFSNSSATSPFAVLAGNKSPTKPTATSAFAASGFGALAGSSTSGFGALAKSTGLSSFASPPAAGAPEGPTTDTKENAKPPKSTFGGALGAASPFASAGTSTSAFGSGSGSSGFGKLGAAGFGGGFGGGFGSGFGGTGGSKLSSFAGSGTPGVIGSSKTGIKPFGASADEEGDNAASDDEETGVKSPKQPDDEKKDERFFEQEIETGEENETTEYTCRAKLYNFVTSDEGKKEWKERGLGVVRLNVLNPGPTDEFSTPKARLVMRADGSHRVVLNTPIKKEIKFGSVTGEEPQGGYLYFMGSIDDKPKLELLQMKVRHQFAIELYERIADLQKEM